MLYYTSNQFTDKVEDTNFTRGLENLIKTFESLLVDDSSREPSPKK